MNDLAEYIYSHTERGECQRGKCYDKQPDREAPTHSANVHFFWVSGKNEPSKERLLELLKQDYPEFERLAGGPSYMEMGAAVGDQGLALLLIGLGEIVGLWRAVTPERLGMTGDLAKEMAGNGLIMCSGLAA